MYIKLFILLVLSGIPYIAMIACGEQPSEEKSSAGASHDPNVEKTDMYSNKPSESTGDNSATIDIHGSHDPGAIKMVAARNGKYLIFSKINGAIVVWSLENNNYHTHNFEESIGRLSSAHCVSMDRAGGGIFVLVGTEGIVVFDLKENKIYPLDSKLELFEANSSYWQRGDLLAVTGIDFDSGRHLLEIYDIAVSGMEGGQLRASISVPDAVRAHRWTSNGALVYSTKSRNRIYPASRREVVAMPPDSYVLIRPSADDAVFAGYNIESHEMWINSQLCKVPGDVICERLYQFGESVVILDASGQIYRVMQDGSLVDGPLSMCCSSGDPLGNTSDIMQASGAISNQCNCQSGIYSENSFWMHRKGDDAVYVYSSELELLKTIDIAR